MLDKYLEEGLNGKSTMTVKTYRFALEKFGQWLEGAGADLESFARSDVQQYIDFLASKKKSASTINAAFHAIKSFAKWAGKRNAVEDIKVVKMPDVKKQAPKSLDKIDRNRVIRDIDRTENKRNFAILMTLLHTGIRVSELVALDKSDVEIGERSGSLIVRAGKGNKERTVPLNAEARRAIKQYQEERGEDDQPALFLSNRQERISVRSVQHLLSQHNIHPHQLRHTFITGLVRANQDIAVIQSMSGHSSADMILRYSMPSEEDKRQAVEDIYKD